VVDGPRFSVALRCRNEEAWIGHCIQSLLDHLNDPEINVIYDNNITDESMDVVRMFEHHADITSMSIVGRYSPGSALNQVINSCSHSMVLVISAHCVINQFDIELCARLLDMNVAVFGKQIPVYRGRRIGGGKRYFWSHFGDTSCTNMVSSIERRPFLHNAFCAYQKDVVKVNPFNESLYGKEDREWAGRMIETGHTIQYDPELSCFHHWTPNGATWRGIA
jgi:glycosyltransferase involved in cell wall biosynthesis